MEIMPNPNNITGMSEKFEDYEKDKKYYFRTKDGKEYNGNTNYKFVGKNNKVFYTGKTFTKYSELLQEFPNGYFVTEDFHDTPFTKWLKSVQDDENPFLFPIYGQGETMTEENAYARDILGQNLTQFNQKTGRRDVISTSMNEPPQKQPPNKLDVATPETPAPVTPPDEMYKQAYPIFLNTQSADTIDSSNGLFEWILDRSILPTKNSVADLEIQCPTNYREFTEPTCLALRIGISNERFLVPPIATNSTNAATMNDVDMSMDSTPTASKKYCAAYQSTVHTVILFHLSNPL
ncbi:hypothetical protein T492DRAFT_1132056 [Pavlovales sp. CCMP2436]|nr:hypothetical protein T492DRAFT_1132056 [Pavlovales sp. CCMP2436]